MIDVLPTLLDLLGLPPTEIAQGQSLAPLMLGRDGWEPRPVILDEFYADLETGELAGRIEVGGRPLGRFASDQRQPVRATTALPLYAPVVHPSLPRRWKSMDDPERQMLAAWVRGERTGSTCPI